MNHKLKTFMKESGFELLRNNGKHQVWSDGVTKTITPRGNGVSATNERNFKSQSLKAVRKRKEGEMYSQELKTTIQDQVTAKSNEKTALKPPAPKSVETLPQGLRLDRSVRGQMLSRVKELKSVGLSTLEISKQLVKEGYKNTRGEPVDRQFVSNLWVAHERREKKMKEKAELIGYVPKPATPTPPISVPAHNPVIQAAPTPEKPRSIHDSGFGKRHDLITSVLTDPTLTESQKVRIIMICAET